jgi:hypothetical protein
MGQALVNTEELHIWVLGAGNTGLSGTMSTVLTRSDGTTVSVGSETVTITEDGSSGTYLIKYTPANAQVYRGVVTESSNGYVFTFEDDVQAIPGTSTSSDSYCDITDVEAYAQVGTYGSSTKPTDTEVLGFMANRASDVYSVLREFMDDDAPGPPNFDVTIDTGNDAGKALDRGARQANAIGAAIDALEAGGSGDSRGRTERVAELEERYTAALEKLRGLAIQYVSPTNRIHTHITEGEITLATVTSRQETGLRVTSETDF